MLVGMLSSVGWTACRPIDPPSGGPVPVVTESPSTSDGGLTPQPSCGSRVDDDGDGYARAVAESCKGSVPLDSAMETFDCDDEDPKRQLVLYPDGDGDGAGAFEGEECLAEDTPGYVANRDDCDDSDPRRSWTAPEASYDGFDSNCDGYDVPVARWDAKNPPTLDGAPWCLGPRLAVVMLEQATLFATAIQIANVGTQRVTGAFVVITEYDAAFSAVTGVQTIELPALVPGQGYKTQLFTAGNYSVAFSYSEAAPGDAGISGEKNDDAGAAVIGQSPAERELDGSIEDAGRGNAEDAACESKCDSAQCERAQAPFRFTVRREVLPL